MRIETTREEWNAIPSRHKWKLLDFFDSQQDVYYSDYDEEELTIYVTIGGLNAFEIL